MVIYLKHPQHGTKVAVSEAEAQYDIKNGWNKFDTSPVVVESTKDLEREEWCAKYQDKFGSKPHWKMNTDTIKSKVEEITV